jgi:hypothetical protein
LGVFIAPAIYIPKSAKAKAAMKLYSRREFLHVTSTATLGAAFAYGLSSPSEASSRSAFTIRLKTARYRPGAQIAIRTSADNWRNDIIGKYQQGEWVFGFPADGSPPGMEFKFILDRRYWMEGPSLFVKPKDQADYFYDKIKFSTIVDEIQAENGDVQRRFFPATANENKRYDVIVIGSGMGGGVLADQLSDLGLDVLLLEAGGFLFPTHVGNLPRRHEIGKSNKNISSFWDDFKLKNYTNAPDSKYVGAQAFNLGGRSLFWGGLIPRLAPWELELWPDEIKQYLETRGYDLAERLVKKSDFASGYEDRIKLLLSQKLQEFQPYGAPMAIEQTAPELRMVPTGVFSTADLLMESRLTDHDKGNHRLTINLNHLATSIESLHGRATGVIAHDLVEDKVRTFRGKAIVLSCGTVESAKLAKLSRLADAAGLIGIGMTSHPIFYMRFSVPSSSPVYNSQASAKVLLRHKRADLRLHPYNVILELGDDFNEGRFVDPDLLRAHDRAKGRQMFCGVAFLLNAKLMEGNSLLQSDRYYEKPLIKMLDSPTDGEYLPEINGVKNKIVEFLGGRPIAGDKLTLKRAGSGAAAHEVGTLRMSVQRNGTRLDGVVDVNLKFFNYDNLYACDLSVFPSSPAANPSLTLVALALRLAEHLKRKLS